MLGHWKQVRFFSLIFFIPPFGFSVMFASTLGTSPRGISADSDGFLAIQAFPKSFPSQCFLAPLG